MTGLARVDDNHLLAVTLVRRSVEADDIISLQLRPAQGGQLPRFSAGAHVDLHLPNGLVRQYSLCGDPRDEDRYEIAILREEQGRGGSKSAHDELREGDTLRISAPRNHFPLEAAPHTVLFAGGIGITPLLAMARELHEDAASFEFHYSARSRSRAAFADWLAAAPFADSVHFHFDDGPEGQRLDADYVCRTAVADSRLYVCGPAGFMDHVMSAARSAGWPQQRIHHEYFAAPASDPLSVAASGEVFEVECARAGKVVTVPVGQSIVAALRSHGIEVPLSCEQGICGTCSVRVLQGIPDHRDHFLTATEKAANDRLLACCSRALSARLVVDL